MLDTVHVVEEDAKQRGVRSVASVTLEVGELSGAFPHALREAFPIAAKGTMLSSANLSIREIKAEVKCKKCGTEYAPSKDGWSCPSCGSYDVSILRGTELKVVSYVGGS